MSAGILVDVGQSLTSFLGAVISIDIDVTIEESHEWANEVTMNPVEFGSPITDHIQEQPDELHITGFISNAAISDAAIKQINDIDGGQFETRVQTAFDALLALKRERRLVTVYTKYKIYFDMAIKAITLPRSSASGDAIEFSADFIHVRLVETQSANVPAGISRKADKKDGGKKSDTARKAEPQKKAGDKAAEVIVDTKAGKQVQAPNAATTSKTTLLKSLTGSFQ